MNLKLTIVNTFLAALFFSANAAQLPTEGFSGGDGPYQADDYDFYNFGIIQPEQYYTDAETDLSNNLLYGNDEFVTAMDPYTCNQWYCIYCCRETNDRISEFENMTEWVNAYTECTTSGRATPENDAGCVWHKWQPVPVQGSVFSLLSFIMIYITVCFFRRKTIVTADQG